MRFLLALAIVIVPSVVFGQWGVSYHQSALPFVGINYELKERWRPEIRIGTDRFIEEWSLEGVVVFDVLNKPEYELYVGLGANINDFEGSIAVPVGLNVYPFEARRFGFHMEATPLLGESGILRGSLGIRYQFQKKGD